MPTATKKSTYNRGSKLHYAALARKSVDSRIKRHIDVEVMRDGTRVTTFPVRKRETDAGYDITTPELVVVQQGQTHIIKTGLRVSCPKGYFYEVRGRSSLNRKGIEITDNIIDATYTGEIEILVHNKGTSLFRAEIGDRIAQLIFLPQIHVTFKPVEKFTLPEGARGDAGWGSSGQTAFTSETKQQ